MDENVKIRDMICRYFENILDQNKYHISGLASNSYFDVNISDRSNTHLILNLHYHPNGCMTFVSKEHNYRKYSEFKVKYDADNLLDAIGEINMDKLTEIAYSLAPPPKVKSAYKK